MPKLPNLISLCRRHHTLLHDGGYRIDIDEGAVHFVDLFERRIEAVGDKRSRGNVQAIVDINNNAGIDIKPDTTECNWDGRPANYHHIMANLFQNQPYRPSMG